MSFASLSTFHSLLPFMASGNFLELFFFSFGVDSSHFFSVTTGYSSLLAHCIAKRLSSYSVRPMALHHLVFLSSTIARDFFFRFATVFFAALLDFFVPLLQSPIPIVYAVFASVLSPSLSCHVLNLILPLLLSEAVTASFFFWLSMKSVLYRRN